DHCIALALLDQFQGAGHGAVLFLAQNLDGLVFHREHLAGVNDPDAVVEKMSLAHPRPDLPLVADEVKLGDSVAGVERDFDSLDDNLTPVVAAHDIHYDSHKTTERRGNHSACAL